jgi:hypothetical protein
MSAASNVSQTTYSLQQQEEQTTLNVPLQQQEEQTTQGERQQERGRRGQQTTLASNVAQPTAP